MKTLMQILNEKYTPKLGKIGDLNRVKYIRHYTTLEGLIGIIGDGKIKMGVSRGDNDWRRYDIYDTRVVSFHDARYDPEWDELNTANLVGSTMVRTKTLGLHMNDICVCIEYNFVDLPERIQQQCGIISILRTYVADFYSAWSECIDLANSVTKPEEIVLKAPDRIYDEYFSLNNEDRVKWLDNLQRFLQRLKGVKFTQDDAADLLDYAIHRQTQKLINKLLKLGWEKGDENNPLYLAYIELYKLITGEPMGASHRTDFLAYIAKHITKSIKDKINIEIRFGTDIPIEYANRIIIYGGIVDYIESWGEPNDEKYIKHVKKLIKKYKDKYNIEIIPEGEKAKKLR